MTEPLNIKQGTSRIITVTKLRDTTQALLDPTGWAIHAVARTGFWGPEVAVWRDTPTGDEGLAEVLDADPELDPTVVSGEKWIYLRVEPAMSDSWSWLNAVLDVQITEPGTGRKETFSRELRHIPTTVRA